MTFAQLLTEFYARGFSYLNRNTAGQTRAKAWVNEAYLEDICAVEAWPFLEDTETGTAPLLVSDLQDVLFVLDADNDNRLESADLRDLIDSDVDAITTTGVPSAYWLDNLTVTTYPSSGVNLSVRYVKVPTSLTADSDEPLVPARYHGLIVDAAVIRALRDTDEWEASTVAQQQFDVRLAKMRDALLSRNLDNTQYVVRTSEADY